MPHSVEKAQSFCSYTRNQQSAKPRRQDGGASGFGTFVARNGRLVPARCRSPSRMGSFFLLETRRMAEQVTGKDAATAALAKKASRMLVMMKKTKFFFLHLLRPCPLLSLCPAYQSTAKTDPRSATSGSFCHGCVSGSGPSPVGGLGRGFRHSGQGRTCANGGLGSFCFLFLLLMTPADERFCDLVTSVVAKLLGNSHALASAIGPRLGCFPRTRALLSPLRGAELLLGNCSCAT